MNMTLLVKRSAPLRTIITSPMEERENVSLLLGAAFSLQPGDARGGAEAR